ncbi:MAG: hypothetical protein R3B93_22485 [Bacteroidia bacterium]
MKITSFLSAAIEAGTSSGMPYYSFPAHTEFEEVGYAFNKVLPGCFERSSGITGIINSDTGPIDMMPWGVEDLSIVERYKKALEARGKYFSGTADPGKLIETPQYLSGIDGKRGPVSFICFCWKNSASDYSGNPCKCGRSY